MSIVIDEIKEFTKDYLQKILEDHIDIKPLNMLEVSHAYDEFDDELKKFNINVQTFVILDKDIEANKDDPKTFWDLLCNKLIFNAKMIAYRMKKHPCTRFVENNFIVSPWQAIPNKSGHHMTVSWFSDPSDA